MTSEVINKWHYLFEEWFTQRNRVRRVALSASSFLIFLCNTKLKTNSSSILSISLGVFENLPGLKKFFIPVMTTVLL
jgi:hypothetical protein